MSLSDQERDWVVPISAMTASALRARVRDLRAALDWPSTGGFADRAQGRTRGLRAQALGIVAADLGCDVEEVPLHEPVVELGLTPMALREVRVVLDEAAQRHPERTWGRAVALDEIPADDFGASPAGVDTPWRMADVTVTLACGRDPMPTRLAVVARSLPQLVAGLGAWLVQEEPCPVLDARGVRPETVVDDGGDEALAVALGWAGGGSVDWDTRYAGAAGRRVPLPVYRFAGKRHWLEVPGAAADGFPLSAAEGRGDTEPGPVTTSRRLAATDELLTEHLVGGRPTLPGVVHLAIAMRTAQSVIGPVVEARDVVWVRTASSGGEELVLEMTAKAAGPGAVEVVISDGGRRCSESTWVTAQSAPGHPRHDLAALRGMCSDRIDATEFYEGVRAGGITYGTLFRGLTTLYVGNNLVVARAASPCRTQELLDPTLLDAALQSIAAFAMVDARGAGPSRPLPLPFAVDRVAVAEPLPSQCWIVGRRRSAEDESVFDIDMTDDEGRPLLSFEGLRVRRAAVPGTTPAGERRAPGLARPGDSEATPLLTAVPTWRLAPLSPPASALPGGRALVLYHVPPAEDFVGRLRESHPDGVSLAPLDAPAPEGTWDEIWVLSAVAQPAGASAASEPVLQVFDALHDLLDRGSLHTARALYVVVGDVYGRRGGAPRHPASAGVLGLVRSLAQERRDLDVRVLSTETEPDWRLPGMLAAEPRTLPGRDVCYDAEGRRWERTLTPVDLREDSGAAVRRGGTYLVVGGAGGIGTALTRHLCERYDAHVIVTGRSPLDDALRLRLESACRFGGSIDYRVLDTGDRDGMRRLVDELSACGLDGAVHAAMVLDDGILENQTRERFAAAVAPKIDGTRALLEALQGHPVDVVLILGSVQSFTNAPGQSSYAAASTGQDAMAQWGRRALGLPVRLVHLGPWGEVGAVSSPGQVAALANAGWGALSTTEGLRAIETAAAAGCPSVAVLRAEFAVRSQLGIDAVTPSPVWSRVELDGVQGRDYEAFEAEVAREALRVLATSPSPRPETHRYVAALRAVSEAAVSVAASTQGWGTAPRPLPEPLRSRRDLADECLRFLPGWLAGTTTAHEFLLAAGQSSPLSRFYRTEAFNARAQEILVDRVIAEARRLAADGRGPLRILEVGAGVGSTTIPLVNRLRASGLPFCYEVTDVSERLTTQVRGALGDEGLGYGRLDLTDPASMVAYRGSHVVIAGNVIHAVPGLDEVLSGLASLLADDGLLLLSELTRTSVVHTAVFGLFDGWWSTPGDDRRCPNSPLLDPTAWRAALEAAGFAGIEATTIAPRGGAELHAVICARRTPMMHEEQSPHPPAATDPVTIVPASAPTAEAAPARPATLDREALSEVDLTTGALADADEALTAKVARLVTRLTAQTLEMDPDEVRADQPFSAMGADSLVGVDLVNAIGAELGVVLKTIVIFDHPTVRRLSEYIVATYGAVLASPTASGATIEPQPAVAASTPPSPVRPAPVAALGPDPAADGVRSRPAAAPTTARGVVFAAPALRAQPRTAAIEVGPPGPGQVELNVRAFPINFSDDLVARGLYPMMPDFPVVPGVEVSGVVTRVGEGVTHVAPGAEVIALTRPEMGGQATAVVVDADFIVPKPASVPHEVACGVPAGYLAMSVALDLAGVRAGETVLITGASGNNGTIAAQLARRIGARVLGTASTPAKVAHLVGVGVEGICHRDEDIVAAVARLTGDRGADVVINTLGGDAIQSGLRALAPNGRYVETAVFGLQAAGPLDLSSLVDNQSFFSLNAKKYFIDHPERRPEYLRRLADDLASGAIRPMVSEVFELDDVASAYQAKADRNHIGRVVVRVAATEETQDSSERPAAAAGASPTTPHPADIAIVGMSARYAGAPNLDRLWEVLDSVPDLNRSVPDERWDRGRYVDEDRDRRDATYCDRGYFVDGIDEFDAEFFGMSGLEARQTDPQQRVFLQEAWRALENAGVPRAQVRGARVGVFVGAGPSGYEARMDRCGAVREAQSFWGNESSVLAARISYALDLRGPSVAINTACSSSLVALHLACRSLQDGDCDTAITGGVFLMLDPAYFVIASNGMMLAPDGRCKTFRADADGFGPGEGAGVLVLRRLEEAVAAGDHIWGVVRGTAINQDGRTNGITAPNGVAQTAVVGAAQEAARIDAAGIDYIEAHGTGTRLGDPIEVGALGAVFAGRAAGAGCRIGSAKAVVGHTAAAAGVAGVIKVCLALDRDTIPGMPGGGELNPLIDLGAGPFRIADREAWPRRADRPRRAGVSSFGFSGTNAHAVIEEPPADTRQPTAAGHPLLFPVSAEAPELLAAHLRELAIWVRTAGSRHPLTDIAHTLQMRRDHAEARCVVAAESHEDLARALEQVTPGEVSPAAARVADGAVLSGFVTGTIDCWPADASDGVPAEARVAPLPARPFRRDRYWFPEDDWWHAHRDHPSAEGAGDIDQLIRDYLDGSCDEDETLRRLGGMR